MEKLYFLLVLIFFSNSFAHAQKIVHTVRWEDGVNKKTVKQWIVSLDKLSTINSTTYISKKSGGKDSLHVSGHRDVVVWVPSTTDLTQSFIVVLWFHGHWGYVPSRTFENRTLKQLVPLTSSKNFVLVIPEMPWSVHTKTPTKRNSQVWKKPGDFMRFIEQVKTKLIDHVRTNENVARADKRLGEIDYRIVGHSAGGSTIKRLGITGDLCRLKPTLIVWSDSSYGNWLDLAWEGCLKNRPDILTKIFVQKWQSPYHNAIRFVKKLQEHPANLKIYVKDKGWSHKLIGDNIVRISELLGDQR